MLDETGMTWFAIVRSRMDMVAIGERRARKRPKARAYAMVSAVGVADWYNPQGSNDKPDS
ncbi:hypothetical protein ColKHC_06688 [Colletotrichum higginsianum]|nr:hypothetical protein ColKHC_06688 [Colletotrichum higginsianum]